MTRWVTGLLLVVVCVIGFAQEKPDQLVLPKEVSTDWWGTVQRDIAASEYHISKAKRPLPESGDVLQAPNRKQGFRTWFLDSGFSIEPRDSEEAAWSFGLQLIGYGPEGKVYPVHPAEPEPETNRIHYPHDEIVQWCENREDGLEHGFTVNYPVDGDTMEVRMAITGNLTASLTNDTTVELFNEHGIRLLTYDKLVVTDAEGKILDALFRLENNWISILADIHDAVFPIEIDPLVSTPAWVMESNSPSARFGCSVSSAGDVNGDGYSDVIIGAWSYDNGQNDEGRAYVFLGSNSGLSTMPVWTYEPDHANDQFGGSVSTAGDVNGDGFADVVVGSATASYGQTYEGRVYVFHGSELGPGTTPAWDAQPNNSSRYLGCSVSNAGDVNGDGYADIVVGSFGYQNGEPDEGCALVYYGSPVGIVSAGRSRVESNQYVARFGSCVSGAGDVNGDGYADIIVGARTYDNGETDEGRAYVYHGAANGLRTNPAWIAESNQANSEFGYSVCTAGDVNGDGYSDVIVGSRFYSNGELGEGRSYLYLGSGTGLEEAPAWTVESNQDGAEFGSSVASAGDVNGDGYADVIVGAPLYDSAQTNEGMVFLYLGSREGLSSLPDWSSKSNKGYAEMGSSVSCAGDVNGDGLSDLIIGAERYSGGETHEGRAYVFLGAPSELAVDPAWTAESNQADAEFGHSVSSAGDVNGDGYGDVIVGARYYDNGQFNEGRSFVYLGSVSGLSESAAWTAESDRGGAYFGYSVSTAGDVNGDGYSDVIVGAYGYYNGEPGEGRAFVYLGSSSGLSSTPAWTAESDQAGAWFGISVSSAGDVNGDGYGDVIVGAQNYDNGQTDEGRAFVYLGSSSGVSASAAWTAESDQAGAWFGISVSSAGDVNGDGYGDVIVGAQNYDNGQTDEGRAFVYLGSSSGLRASAAWTAESDQAGAWFGISVSSAGDVNGDGYGDVLVGAPYYNNGQPGEGRAFVYLGSSSGPSASAAWTAESDNANAFFGQSVSFAGDVNGDGYGDVIVGAFYYDNGETNEGRAYVYLGSPSGLSSTPAWTAESNQADARFGSSVSAAGDVNGDGYGDVIVGAPHYDNGETDEGEAFVYLGNDGPGLFMLPGQFRADGVTRVCRNGNTSPDVVLQLRGYTSMGRARVRLQWEACPLTLPFELAQSVPSAAVIGESADWIDTGDGISMISETISGLSVNTPYHWRVRLVYHPADAIFGQTTSRWYSIQDNGWNDVDFRTTNPSYTISGTVSDGVNPIPDVTITFSHDAGTVVTDAAGQYSYTVSYGTETIISASHAGYSDWSPSFIVLHDVTMDQPDQNFMATINGYIVSGTITDGTNPINGAALTFSHDGSVVFSTISGTYSTIVPFGTTTTISPSAAGYSSWSPSSRTLTNVISDQPGQDFAAILNGVTVSGTVTDGTDPIPDVTISFSHDGGTVVTDAAGNYSYTVPYGTTTTLIPSHSGYSNWSPVVYVLDNITVDQPDQNFMATANGYIVSGVVTDGTNPINGAALTFSHDGSVVYSDVSGAYSNVVPFGTTTTIMPSAPGFSSWSPPSRTLTDIAANQTGQDFAAILNGVTVSGTVTDGSVPLEGVTITFSHDSGTALTDGSGTFSYVVPYGSDTVVTPSLANHTFTPVNIPLANLTADSTGNDFLGSTTQYTITATAGPNGAIDPSGMVTVAHGADQTFILTPDPGYHVDYLLVDGVTVPPVPDYTFATVTAAHAIHVSFAVNIPPVITSLTADQGAGNLPITVTLHCDASDPDGGEIVRYEWDLNGDGVVDQITGTPYLTHEFRNAGEQNVSVTVTDDEGERTSFGVLTIHVTDAKPLMLPVGLPAKLDNLRGTDNTAVTLWAVNPYGELVTGELNALDDAGTTLATEVFHIGGHGKLPLDLGPFSGLNYQDVSLTADHFFHLVVDARGDGFRFTCYQPLGTSVNLFVPHVAEAIDQWETVSFLSNQEKLGVDLTVHGSSSTLAPAYQLTTDLSSYLPETVDTALSWGSFTPIQDTPFTDPDTLTGFEAFLRNGSDGAALKLVSQLSTMLYVPHIPTNTAIFWSGFTFLNPSESPVNATATLYDNGGKITGVYPFQVAAETKVKGVLKDLFPGSEDKATWGIILADGEGLIGLELFGTYQEGICGFPLSGETLESGIFPLTETGVGNWTGLAFANPNDVPVMLELLLVSFTGEVKAVHETEIAPMSRSAAVVGELFSLADLSEGDYLWFSASAPLSAVSVSGDDDRNWMSAIPAVK